LEEERKRIEWNQKEEGETRSRTEAKRRWRERDDAVKEEIRVFDEVIWSVCTFYGVETGDWNER